VPIEKLQSHFREVVLEFTKQLKELKLCYVQLSGDMDTKAELIAIYKNERAIQKAQQGNFQEVNLTENVESAQGEAGAACFPHTRTLLMCCMRSSTQRSRKARGTCAPPSTEIMIFGGGSC
jgi:hypothetical protein